mgnify:CR=1 FL=1
MSGKSTKASLPIREDVGALGGVTIHGLSSIEVNSPEQAIKLLYQGGRRRTVRETSCNERSSRSHAIFQLSVEVCAINLQGSPVTRRSLLNLVDCAGKWLQILFFSISSPYIYLTVRSYMYISSLPHAETRLINYVRDVPESAVKPPILGKLARDLRPGLGVFAGVKLGSRPGGK